MEIQPDFRELLALFNQNQIEYVVVGAFLMVFHGAPLFSGDIDLYVRPSPENAKRITKTLADFDFGSLGLKEEDFNQPGRIVQLGWPFVKARID